MRSWTDTNGNKRHVAEVVADNVYFVDSKRDGEGGGYQPGYQQGTYQRPGYGGGYNAPSGPPAPDQYSFQDVTEETGDLPF